jgi:hypothetical protein
MNGLMFIRTPSFKSAPSLSPARGAASTDVDVIRRFAFEDLLKLRLERFGGGKPSLGAGLLLPDLVFLLARISCCRGRCRSVSQASSG